MRRRPPLALLFVGRDVVRRADLSGEGSVGRTFEMPRAEGGSLAAAVRAALAPTPRPRSAFVLTEEVWTQTHAMPRRQLEGLDEATLARALGYELEPMTGIPSERAAVAVRRLPGDGEQAELWVSLIDAQRLAELRDALAELGVRLRGVCHPAGLATPAREETAAEIWEEATLLVHRNGRGDRLVALAARPGQRSWRRGVESWLAALPSEARDVPARSSRPLAAIVGGEPALARLREAGRLPPESPEALLGPATAARLERGEVPVLVPPKQTGARLDPLRLGLLLVALVLAAVSFDAVRLWREAARLEAEVAAAEEAARQRTTLERTASALALKREELRSQIDEEEARLSAVRSEIEAQKRRLHALLVEAAARKPANVLFDRIEPGGAGLEIVGLAVGERAVDDFAEALGAALADDGFAVRPARVEATRGPRGVTVFRFRLPVEMRPAASGGKP